MEVTKKQIAIIGPGYPYRNGAALYLSHLCKKLSEAFEVTLVSYTSLYPNFLFPGKTQYDHSEKKVISYPNIRLIHSLNPISWFKTARYLNRLKPDLIAFDWWHPFFAFCHFGIIFSLDRKLKNKVIFITENVISHEAKKFDKALTLLALKRAKAFLALSGAVEAHLNHLFKVPIFRSELPIYDIYKTDDFDKTSAMNKFSIKDRDIVLLFFGLIRKYKGLDILLHAFAELRKKNKNLKLLIAGECYEDESVYLNLIKELSVEKEVIFENRFVENEEVKRYFGLCDVVILPYRSATQSGVLNVAYGFQKPVIVTNVGELKSLVDEDKTGIVVENATPSDIAAGIQRYLLLRAQDTNFAENIDEYIRTKHRFAEVNKVFKEMISYLNKDN